MTDEDYVEGLREALIHIEKVASRSETQTNRLIWIQARAESAINGDDKWRDLKMPKYQKVFKRQLVCNLIDSANAVVNSMLKHHAKVKTLAADLAALQES